ncbi:MAG: hypothetical protein ACK2UA_11405 [Anaerolineae bacterium]|jgi:hypothetical protein
MLDRVSELTRRAGKRLHAFAIGTTLALGAVLFSQVGQSCAISGQ